MNIEELKRLAEAATPGPWYAEGGTINKDVIYVYSERSDFEVCHGDASDSDYIAAANPAAILELIRQWDELLAALREARMFIRNGIELGFIRMPDADTPDPAHDTLPHIEAVIARVEG